MLVLGIFFGKRLFNAGYDNVYKSFKLFVSGCAGLDKFVMKYDMASLCLLMTVVVFLQVVTW